jgi:hypothetical protein
MNHFKRNFFQAKTKHMQSKIENFSAENNEASLLNLI